MEQGPPTWRLQITGGPTDREGLLASALQAAHACIDKFGSDVAKAEERNAAEQERLWEAWRRFHEVLENSREAGLSSS